MLCDVRREIRDRISLDELRQGEGEQQLGVVLPDDPVDHPLGRGRQDESGEAVHQQQREPQGEAAAMGVDETPRLLPGARGDRFLGRSGVGIGHGT